MSRPRTYKTHGIVLKHMPLGEADRIVTVYSRERGKLRAVARGVRRTTSKLRGHLETLSHVAVSISEGRSLDAITEAQSIHAFRGLREDLQTVSEAVYMAELVDGFSADSSPDAKIFDLFLGSLVQLDEGRSSPQLVRFFEVQLLASSGFGPEFQRCVECGIVLEPREHVFSLAMGGIVCPACKGRSGEAVVPLSLNGIKLLRHFQRTSKTSMPEMSLSPALATELQRVLRSYIRHVLERDLKSAEFMNLVASTAR